MAHDRTMMVSPQGDSEILIRRVFDAPTAPVFDAFTKPVLLRRWMLGPPGWSWKTCDVDLRPGGAYHYVWSREQDGSTRGMGGVFRDVVIFERIVNTESFDPPEYPARAVATIAFEERRGKTTVTETLHYESRQARDDVLASEIVNGLERSFDRLDVLLEPSGARSRRHAHAH